MGERNGRHRRFWLPRLFPAHRFLKMPPGGLCGRPALRALLPHRLPSLLRRESTRAGSAVTSQDSIPTPGERTGTLIPAGRSTEMDVSRHAARKLAGFVPGWPFAGERCRYLVVAAANVRYRWLRVYHSALLSSQYPGAVALCSPVVPKETTGWAITHQSLTWRKGSPAGRLRMAVETSSRYFTSGFEAGTVCPGFVIL